MKRLSVGIIITQAPFASDRARQGLDLALAMAAFDQTVTLIFQGPGRHWLQQSTNADDTDALGIKDVRKQIDELQLYDITELIVVCDDSATAPAEYWNWRLPVQELSAAQLQQRLRTLHRIWVY